MSGLEHDVFVARWDTGFTDDEITALLGGDFEAFDKLQVLTASANPKAHTGAMVALVPSADDLARLAVEGGEDAAELHLTLVFLGEADLISEEMRSRIIEAAGSYFTDAVTTEAFSVNVFNPHNPDMETAVVLGIKGEGMVDNQAGILSAVRGVYNGVPEQHKPWIPHVTLKYTDDVRQENQDDFLVKLGPIKFDTLRFAFGGEVIDVPLYDEEPLTAAFLRKWREKEHPRDADGKFSRGFTTPTADIQGAATLSRNISPKDKVGSLSGDEAADAIYNLTTATSDYINPELRRKKGKLKDLAGAPGVSSGSVLSEQNVQKTVRNADIVMENSPLKEDVVVFRGFRNTSSFGPQWKAGGDNAGLTWTEHSFLSTTNDEDFLTKNYLPKGSIKMRMSVPKGTGAVYIENAGSDFGQAQPELLLQRGLRFRIVNDHGVEDGIRTLDVEVVR
jgi:2'-5' RNA ligase